MNSHACRSKNIMHGDEAREIHTIDRLTSPSRIYEAFETFGFGPSSLLGQNFLIDRNIQEALAASLKISEGTRVVEIGPGLGHLTRVLVEREHQTLAIEKDTRLAQTLHARLSGPDRLVVWNRDILDIGTEELQAWSGGQPVVILGNLPYYCSTQILARVFEDWLGLWDRCGFLLQEEVADRIVAGPGSKLYGRLSLLTQVFSTPVKARRLPPHLFVPAPDVNSAWCIFQRRAEIPDVSPRQVSSLSGICFGERRKTLANNLAREFGREKAQAMLEQAGIDGRLRAEQVPVDGFLKLIKTLG